MPDLFSNNRSNANRGGSTSGPKSRGGRQRQQQQNNNQNKGQGEGRERFAAAQAQRLREQAVAAQQAQATQQAAQLASIQAANNYNQQAKQAQALAEKQAQDQRNQKGIAAYKEMMEGPVVAGNPNVVGNTYANAPTQFTEGRSGTSYYPANAPDTMFRGLMGNITGGGLVSGAADLVGEDSYVGGLLKAYSEFDPVGDLAQQTVYGMNGIARDEYVRQEASNPDWPMMSEKERVQLARKPQMDNQLPHAFINDGIINTANDAQLNAMRPFIKDSNMSEAQFNSLPIEMRRQLTKDVNPNNLIIGSANQGDNPYIPPVEEVAPESYTSYMADYSPMFSFAGKSGLSSFAEGGVVKSQGIGRLFEDINR